MFWDFSCDKERRTREEKENTQEERGKRTGEGYRRRRKRIRNKDNHENMTFILLLLGDQVNRLNPFLILE